MDVAESGGEAEVQGLGASLAGRVDSSVYAGGIGPRWVEALSTIAPSLKVHTDGSPADVNPALTPMFCTTVVALEPGNPGWPVRTVLSNGQAFDVDFVVSATGVRPCGELLQGQVSTRALRTRPQACAG